MAKAPTRKIKLTIDQLNASLDSFLVEPAKTATRGQVVSAEDTAEIGCSNGATCNFKCGPTAYWECYTTPDWGCVPTDGTCYPVCATALAYGDPFCP